MHTNICYVLIFLLSFLCCTVCTFWLIPRLRAMKMGQRILKIGPVWHAKKEGTPTMGGMAFLFTTALLALLFLPLAIRHLTGEEVYLLYLTILFCMANGAVGIVDDLTKLRHKCNEGLSPTQKLVLQIAFAAAYLALLRLFGVWNNTLQLSFLGEVPLGFATFFVLMLLLLGMVNCANLTDGIDGLATTNAAVIYAFFALYAAYRNAFVPASLAALALGCALSFFFFNRYPAKIFMGDTGSLFLGAIAVALPLLLRAHLLAVLCGIVYVIEGLSVILQVLYYKLTRKRLFLMAPIHHHFEKCGWSENKIVACFSGLTAIACLLCWFLP